MCGSPAPAAEPCSHSSSRCAPPAGPARSARRSARRSTWTKRSGRSPPSAGRPDAYPPVFAGAGRVRRGAPRAGPRRRHRVPVAHRTAAEAPRHGGAAQGTGGGREAARVPVERSGLDRRVHGGTPREMCNLALARFNRDPAWGPPAGAPTCSTAAANTCRSETTASLRGREGDRRVAPLSRPATRQCLPRSGARDT